MLIQLISSLKFPRKIASLSAFSTFTNKFMTYWPNPMLSTSSDMISIGCNTTSRWVTKCGYICRRSASLDPTASFTRSDMGHTLSPRLSWTMPSSSVFHHSLVYTQFSMWTAFDPTFHLYWTRQTWQNNSHQQSYTPTTWNKPQLIGLWTHRSRTPASRRSSYIELSKQANSFSRQSVTRDQVQQRFSHLMEELNAMGTISS